MHPQLLPSWCKCPIYGGRHGSFRTKPAPSSSFSPWFTSRGSSGGPVVHSPRPPSPKKEQGAAEGAARVASPHGAIDT